MFFQVAAFVNPFFQQPNLSAKSTKANGAGVEGKWGRG